MTDLKSGCLLSLFVFHILPLTDFAGSSYFTIFKSVLGSHILIILQFFAFSLIQGLNGHSLLKIPFLGLWS
jgi:hypothetical protein